MRYLSEEWITAADLALKAATPRPPTSGMVIEQHVEGAVSYRVTLGDSPGVAVITAADPGATTAAPADAVFSQNLATAVAVAQGTTDAHQAFLLGHITFEGNIEVLIEQRDAFTWLEATLAPLLAETTF